MTPTDETPRHIQQAEGLRHLAAFIEANPELACSFQYTLQDGGLNAHLIHFEDKAEGLGVFARAALRAGAKVDKDIDEDWHNLVLHFGAIHVDVLARRDEVCERVQVGTETVTRKVRDETAAEAALAEIPEHEVTEEVPVYEWDCKPLLASMRGGAA